MSVACAAKVFRHFPLEGDPSNKPLEWTGLQQLSAPPPQAPLPATQGSVEGLERTSEYHLLTIPTFWP